MTSTLHVDDYMRLDRSDRDLVDAWLQAHEVPLNQCYRIDFTGDLAEVWLYKHRNGQPVVVDQDLVTYTVPFVPLQPFPIALTPQEDM